MKKAIAVLLSAVLAIPAALPAFAQDDKAEKKKPSRAEAREERRAKKKEAAEKRREAREAKRERRESRRNKSSSEPQAEAK